MDTVPYIISTKDFSYLSDMFDWNYNALKQVNQFIDEVKDENIKDLLIQCRNMHLDHLNFIISILKKDYLDMESEDDLDE